MNISYYFRFSASRHRCRYFHYPILIGLLCFGVSGSGSAETTKTTSKANSKATSKLAPAKIKQIKLSNKSFKQCQKSAIQDFKSQKLTQPQFKSALESCKERYPGAGLYIACKKRALAASNPAKAKKSADNTAEEIAECRQFLTAAAFDPDDSVPFFYDSGQLFFAGVGLNKSTSLKALSPPNFDCARLVSAVKTPSEASYILFGNQPSMFTGLDALSPADLARRLKMNSKAAQKEARSDNGLILPGVGKMYGAIADKSSAMFFPSAPCDFDAQTGNIFSGLSIYYLTEPEAQVSPYFGIAYYKAGQRAITTQDLILRTTTKLGSDFRLFRKNSQVVFLAESGVPETDSERDPRNLCRSPRKHSVIAAIQSQKDNPRQPEYLIVANVKNLCDYGDRLARRVAK